jgi:hypothetical protein
MNVADTVRIVLDFIIAVFVPILLFNMKRQDTDRAARFKHLDDCIDDTKKNVIELKERIAGQAVTRADLERALMGIRAEINMERLERERSSQGMHDRVMRLENIQLNARGDRHDD